jgi:adenylate cyclase
MTRNLNEQFGKMFERHRTASARSRVAASKVAARFDSIEGDGASVGGESQLIEEYTFQNWLRPLYGKGKSAPSAIGDHPDFVHLSGTDRVEYHGITTLFMDMEGSTKLSRFNPLEDVFRIKNAFVRCAIEVVRAFDGHVHRIMGDAVLAFFGGKRTSGEQGAIDALNCASVLAFAIRNVVLPTLGRDNLGVRIGLDYGRDRDVLWSSYGYPGVDEVTATSFFVDVAAKLQQAAGRNRVMVGQSLKEFLDFPDDLLADKEVTTDGERVRDPFVRPNYSDQSGAPMNYRQFEVKVDDYLRLSPLAASLPEAHNVPTLGTWVHDHKDGPATTVAVPTAVGVAKAKWLRFHVSPPAALALPLQVRFEVENHGTEARIAGEESGKPYQNHFSSYAADASFNDTGLYHWEETRYRGLHFLNIALFSRDRCVGQRRVGVYVV